MTATQPLTWIENQLARREAGIPAVARIFSGRVARQARDFHRQIPGFNMTPLKSLSRLADHLGLGGIWVKDEASRLSLGSFKVLGGSFAIYQYIKRRLGVASALTCLTASS